jgi:hypothetical protein
MIRFGVWAIFMGIKLGSGAEWILNGQPGGFVS